MAGRVVCGLRRDLQFVAHTKIRKTADSEHSHTTCFTRLGSSLSARSDRPKEISQIVEAHPDSVVGYFASILVRRDANKVLSGSRRCPGPASMYSDCVDCVLRILADECQRRFVYLLR